MCKGKQNLGLVKRTCGRYIKEVAARKTLYCSLVRPQLEYASSVWSPYTVKNIKLIEDIQRRATKFILNYPEDMCYTERLHLLELQPLEHRRNITDLILLYKIRNNSIDTNLKQYLIPSTSSYNTRNFDKHNFTQSLHHKQTDYRATFLPRTVGLWNKLPTEAKLMNLKLSQFKRKVTSYYHDQLSQYKPH